MSSEVDFCGESSGRPDGVGSGQPEPEPREVETALWVPLTHLASDEAVDEILIQLEGEEFRLPALNYDDYIIWGLTHRILTGFMDIAREAGLVG